MPRGNKAGFGGPRWSEEREQRLRTLFAMGKGDPEIAHFLGVSTGMVIGKRQRLGLFRGRLSSAYVAALRRAERERQPQAAQEHHPADRAE
jgi:hypothetical protein